MKSLLQSREWADFKASQGWQVHQIEDIFVLEKPLFFGKSFLYAPEVDFGEIKYLGNNLEYIKEIAKKSQAIFFRLEILDEYRPEIIEKLKHFGFIKSFEEVQPEWRQIIDISKSEAEILAQMKPKGRYNIKVAQKNNVVIEKSQKIEEYYKIFCQTAKRDGFEIRPRQYFQKLMASFAHNDIAELLVARYNKNIIAAAIITYFEGVASYLYGASSDEFRNLMAPYLMHWEIIREAKERGCRKYDLLAVAPEDSEEHKYSGITRFKEQFGGRKVHIVGSWDMVYKPVWYKVFKMAEKYRRR